MYPDECAGFGFFDEIIFTSNIAFHGDARDCDEIRFELGVFLCLGWVSKQVVSKRKVSEQVGRAGLKGVDMVGSDALRVCFAVVSAGFDPELSHGFVAESFHR